MARNEPVTSLFAAARLLRASVASLNDQYSRNHCLVAVQFARYLGFIEIADYLGSNGRNHQTVRRPDIGTLVLQQIRTAENRQPLQ